MNAAFKYPDKRKTSAAQPDVFLCLFATLHFARLLYHGVCKVGLCNSLASCVGLQGVSCFQLLF